MERANNKTVIWAVIALISIGLNGYFLIQRSGSSVVSESTIQNPQSKIQYTCPMHPTIVQDHPGDCPICGMDLVKMESPESATQTPQSKIQYTCPMHPTIVQDHPGDCPICGMDLVKMESGGQEASSGGGGGDVVNRAAVSIDPTRQQLIGLKTAVVSPNEIRSEWRLFGRVQIDQTKVSKVNVKAGGYVETVYADFVGKEVRSGDPLFAFYSPDLLTAQREYLFAISTWRLNPDDSQSDSSGIELVRQKLLLLDIPRDQLEIIEQTGEVSKTLTIKSPVSGIITAKNIVEGSYLTPEEAPYEITDYSSVWVIADAYQSDVARVKLGAAATISLESLPDQTFKGKVTYIDPALDPESRTFKIRINVDNSGGTLKPDMFTEVTLIGEQRQSLTIPADAVIPSGRGSMVFVALGEGKFEPRKVTLGEKSGELIEVVSGLEEGESVVTRANFLVDSESSLRAALATVGGQ